MNRILNGVRQVIQFLVGALDARPHLAVEERRRVRLRLPFDEWCDALEASAGLRLLPLDLSVVTEARALPALRDPFDRLIAGTAVAWGVPLISPDRRVTGSGRVSVVW